MQFAIDSNKSRLLPFPNGTGICPGCNNEVVAKCGDINIWHWSHRKAESCDSFSEPESYWHRRWKEIFGKENSEVIIRKNEKWHFADILTKSEVVIEFQNSPLQFKCIVEREDFYGEKMLWVLNGDHYGSHFSFFEIGFSLFSPTPLYEPEITMESDEDKSVQNISVDFKGEKCDAKTKLLIESIGFTYSPSKNTFYKKEGISAESLNKMKRGLYEFSTSINRTLNIFEKEYNFTKVRPSKSWKAARRPIFIDTNRGVLIRITKGMGEKTGRVKFYRTEDFIEKYAGIQKQQSV